MNRFFIFLLTLVTLASCGNPEVTEAPTNSAPDPIMAPAPAPVKKVAQYPTQTVGITTVDRPLNLTGRVVPLQEATVASQVPGIVLPTDKLLQEGKFYRKGETMVQIDNEQLRIGLQADRSSLVTSLVNVLSELSLDYPDDYPVWEQFTNGINPEKLLPELPTISNKQLNYFINARSIPSQYYAIKAKEASLDDYTVTAPFSGQLTMASVEPGSYVAPGAPLAKLSRTDIYEVRAQVSADALPMIKPGQKITLRAGSLGKEYVGTVHRFGPSIDPATQTVPAFIRVSGKGLRSGLYLEAELLGSSLPNVAVLPKDALRRDGTVYVISEGIVKAKTVEVAAVEADRVFLRGLASGDRVITAANPGSIIGTRAK